MNEMKRWSSNSWYT